MELRQLTIFLAVAKLRSFTRAAASLDYVQSNVTAQIHALEVEVGVPLFDRLGGKHVVLTDAGHHLVEYAERLLNLATEAHTAISAGGEPRGTLKIGATATLCTYRLPTILSAFRKRYPDVHLIFRPTPEPELRNHIRTGELDVAFVFEGRDHEGGAGDEIVGQELILLLSAPDHPLVGRETVAPADLEQVDLLLCETNCCYRDLFRRSLNRANVQPTTSFEFNSIEAVKQCVIAGLGVTVLPAITVTHELAQGQLKDLHWSGPDLTAITHMIWHEDKWLSPTLEAFLRLARQMLSSGEQKSNV